MMADTLKALPFLHFLDLLQYLLEVRFRLHPIIRLLCFHGITASCIICGMDTYSEVEYTFHVQCRFDAAISAFASLKYTNKTHVATILRTLHINYYQLLPTILPTKAMP